MLISSEQQGQSNNKKMRFCAVIHTSLSLCYRGFLNVLFFPDPVNQILLIFTGYRTCLGEPYSGVQSDLHEVALILQSFDTACCIYRV
jgi:hypothetical protein